MRTLRPYRTVRLAFKVNVARDSAGTQNFFCCGNLPYIKALESNSCSRKAALPSRQKYILSATPNLLKPITTRAKVMPPLCCHLRADITVLSLARCDIPESMKPTTEEELDSSIVPLPLSIQAGGSVRPLAEDVVVTGTADGKVVATGSVKRAARVIGSVVNSSKRPEG